MAVAVYAPFQTALYDRLVTDTVLQNLALNGNSSVGVYDIPAPQTDSDDPNIYPYITIGDLTADVDDNKTSTGVLMRGFVHCFSRYQGSKECLQILDQIRILLHRKCLAVPGNENWLIFVDLLTNFTEPDGKTRHGVLRYQAFIKEE